MQPLDGTVSAVVISKRVIGFCLARNAAGRGKSVIDPSAATTAACQMKRGSPGVGWGKRRCGGESNEKCPNAGPEPLLGARGIFD